MKKLQRIKHAYHQVSPGEWVQPRRKGYRLACCDCSLVHIVDFRVRDGHIQLRAFRHNRATAQMRRANNVKVRHK